MKILLIEDEKELTRTLKKGLKEAGYNVDVVYDGESGVSLAVTGEYDCIILDYRLPKLNGLEVCREIRRNKVNTPILMLTVVDSVEMKVQCLDVGADDYLTKAVFIFRTTRSHSRSNKKVKVWFKYNSG
jgi:DNA-binding response OmpR family regulator